MHLNNFNSAAFLRDTWQKRPLVIRNPWNDWHNPIDPDDLAGLACEDGVESRLITLAGKMGAQATWAIEHGPVPEKRFGKLGKQPWTLLVQAVDQVVPEVAALIEPFRFVPNWRIDDVMVSYASDGGGVGPHFDQYDVFLIQGLGERRWQVGGICDADTPLLPHDDLRLLANFTAAEEWILEPGDILYVPPRFAHNGVAMGDDCMTYSVGFRAPARSELIAHWCDEVLASLNDEDRYADPDLAPQDNPGEISAAALDRLHAMIAEKLADRAGFADWFGRYTCTRKYPEVDWRPEEALEPDELRAYFAEGVALLRNPASRFSFRRQDGSLALFVDGESFACAGASARFAERICAQTRIIVESEEAGSAAAMDLIAALFNRGCVAFEDEDEE